MPLTPIFFIVNFVRSNNHEQLLLSSSQPQKPRKKLPQKTTAKIISTDNLNHD